MLSLFARDIQVAVLSSGSAGNCTYIGDGHAGVMIDCGLSTKQILARMDAVGLKDAPVNAVLLTHEHSDHVGAARVLARELKRRTGAWVPFYATAGTLGALREPTMPESGEAVEPGKAFKIRHFEVEPFSLPHDAADPVAWRVRIGGTWVGVITDLGRSTSLVESMLRTLSVAVLEFNHDLDMLLDGHYPWPTKQRIRSSHGHLSNDQASELLARGLGPDLRHLVLAHLSQENNTPEKALVGANRALREAGAGRDIAVQVARQDAPLPPVRARAAHW